MNQAEIAEQIRRYMARWIAIDGQQAKGLATHVKPFSCARNALLFKPGHAPGDCLLLSEGLVRAYYLVDDKEVNLRLLSAPVAALPYASFLQGEPSDEYLQALTPLRGFRIRMLEYRENHPGLLAQTLQRMLAERHFLAMHNRLRMLQGRTAAERYAYFLKSMDPEIISGTPGYHIASYLGITPESLSRVRADLDKCQ